MEKNETLSKALGEIQAELKASKGQFNAFGKYKYRSCEDILEAVKPLLAKKNVTLTITDDMILLGNRYYVKATATFGIGTIGQKIIQSTAFAREAETKKGMDDSQITGAASSYARKYALNGLLLIDDTKDADTQNNTKPEPTKTTSTKPTTQPEHKEPPQDKIIISEKQRLRYKAIAREIGWSDDEMHTLIKTFGYDHSKDIKREDYQEICELLEKGISKPEHTQKFEQEMKQATEEKVKDYELDLLDKKALNLKLELNKLTGDDIEYGAILAEFDIEQSHDLKDQEQKAELVTKLANKVIKLGNNG